MLRKRPVAPAPETSARQALPARSFDADSNAKPDVATKVELEPYLAEMQANADLGLPVDASGRFRLVKRVVAKLCWPFLRHQIAFNHAVLQSNRELTERVNRRLEQIEHNLRGELLDFADRSASQAQAEIGDHVAEARRINADLVRELRSLQAELITLMQSVTRSLPPERAPAHLQDRNDEIEIDSSTRETRR